MGEGRRARRRERELAPDRPGLTTRLGAWFAAWLMRVVDLTSRKTVFNPENDLYLRGTRAIYAAFHQGIIFNTVQAKQRGILVMISRSRDGDLATRYVENLGWIAIRGSSSYRGRDAFDAIRTRLTREKVWGSMVCDGPRGPYGLPKVGTLLLARDTQLPIVPVAWWSTRRRMLDNWDRTLIPLPFGHIYFAFGEPFTVPTTTTDEGCEQLCHALGERISQILFRCQEAAGAPRQDLRY